MADKAPTAVVLLEAPGAVCLERVESCYFDSFVLVELVTAESCECVKTLFTRVAGVYGRLLWFASVGICCFDSCKLCLLLYECYVVLCFKSEGFMLLA